MGVSTGVSGAQWPRRPVHLRGALLGLGGNKRRVDPVDQAVRHPRRAVLNGLDAAQADVGEPTEPLLGELEKASPRAELLADRLVTLRCVNHADQSTQHGRGAVGRILGVFQHPPYLYVNGIAVPTLVHLSGGRISVTVNVTSGRSWGWAIFARLHGVESARLGGHGLATLRRLEVAALRDLQGLSIREVAELTGRREDGITHDTAIGRAMWRALHVPPWLYG